MQACRWKKVAVIRGDQPAAKLCALFMLHHVTRKEKRSREEDIVIKDKQPHERPSKEVRSDVLLLEEDKIIPLSNYVNPLIEKVVVYIDGNLSISQKKALTKILMRNKDIFAY